MRNPFLSSIRKRRAVVLVLVLWIVVILSLMAYSLLFQVSSETTITSARRRQLRAEALARAGVAKAIIDLRNDLLFDNIEGEKNFDAEGDVWARVEDGKSEVHLGKDDEGYFTTHVYDEDGLINVNRIGPASIMILQKLIEGIGYNEEDALITASAIIDWRDGDYVPTLPNAPGTTEGDAYGFLKAEDEGGSTRTEDIKPLVMRNEDYLTVDELLEVYGVTPELFFGPGSAEAEYYADKVGSSYGKRFQIEEKQTRRRRRDEPILGLRDYFTVYGSGVVNMNTAPAHVLEAIAAASGASDPESFAERVIRTRRGSRDDDLDNDSAFKDTTELLANPEIQSVVVAGGNLIGMGVRSSTFRIISDGYVGDVRSHIEVLAVRSMLQLTRDENFEVVDRAEEQREQQSGRWSRRENRDDDQRVQYPYVRVIQAFVD